jgi:hypothetical protein
LYLAINAEMVTKITTAATIIINIGVILFD